MRTLTKIENVSNFSNFRKYSESTDSFREVHSVSDELILLLLNLFYKASYLPRTVTS